MRGRTAQEGRGEGTDGGEGGESGERRGKWGRGEEREGGKKGRGGRRRRRKGGGAPALTRGGFRARGGRLPRPRVVPAACCLVWSEDAAVPGAPPDAAATHTRAWRAGPPPRPRLERETSSFQGPQMPNFSSSEGPRLCNSEEGQITAFCGLCKFSETPRG